MVGDIGTVVGSVLGDILLTAGREFLRNIADAKEILYSFLLIALLLFLRIGVFGGLCALIPSLHQRHLGTS
jgi:branched-chain amino acid transport system permease protein